MKSPPPAPEEALEAISQLSQLLDLFEIRHSIIGSCALLLYARTFHVKCRDPTSIDVLIDLSSKPNLSAQTFPLFILSSKYSHIFRLQKVWGKGKIGRQFQISVAKKTVDELEGKYKWMNRGADENVWLDVKVFDVDFVEWERRREFIIGGGNGLNAISYPGWKGEELVSYEAIVEELPPMEQRTQEQNLPDENYGDPSYIKQVRQKSREQREMHKYPTPKSHLQEPYWDRGFKPVMSEALPVPGTLEYEITQNHPRSNYRTPYLEVHDNNHVYDRFDSASTKLFRQYGEHENTNSSNSPFSATSTITVTP